MSEQDRTDARLEREIRDLLDRRDPGAAPHPLRERVARVPEQVPAADDRSRAVRVGAAVVAGLATAAVVLVAVAGWRPGRVTPDTGAGTAVPGMPEVLAGLDWSITVRGPSLDIISPAVALPTILLLVVAVVLLVITLTSAVVDVRVPGGGRLRVGPPQLVVGAGLFGFALVAHLLTTAPLAASVPGWGGPFAVDVLPDGEGQKDAPHPGQVGSLDFAVENRGLLPVVVRAPARWDGRMSIQPERFIAPQWLPETGVGLPVPPAFTLWPGQSAYVRVALRHVPCEQWGVASSPTSTPWPTGQLDSFVPPDGLRASVVTSEMPLDVSVAGLPRVLDVPMGFQYSTEIPERCPATEPAPAPDYATVLQDLAMGPTSGVIVDDPEAAIEDPVPALAIVIVLLVVVLAGGAIAAPRRRAKVALLGAAASIVAVGVAAAALPSVGATDEWVNDAAGEPWGSGSPVVYDVGPSGDVMFGFTLHNPGPASIRLDGFPALRGELELRAVGVGLEDRSTDPADYLAVRQPLTIPAGGELRLLVQATAGRCTPAAGSGESADGAVLLHELPVRWESLGFEHDTPVRLPRSVRVPADARCLRDARDAEAAAGNPDPTAAYFPIDRAGLLVDTTLAWPPIVAALLGGVCAVAAWQLITRGRRRLAVVPGVGVLLVLAWCAVGLFAPVRVGQFFASPGPHVVVGDPLPGQDVELWYVAGDPREPLAPGIGLFVNEAPVGTRFVGLYEPNNRDGFGALLYTGLWLGDEPHGGVGPAARPFDAAVLGASGDPEVAPLWVGMEAGICPAGPDYDPAAESTGVDGWTSRGMDVVLDVLGWRRVVPADLDIKLLEPNRAQCPALQAPEPSASLLP